MSIDEAIYCMRSYLPENKIEQCLGCPYYGSVKKGQVSYCKSSEAHKLAIKALEILKESLKDGLIQLIPYNFLEEEK